MNTKVSLLRNPLVALAPAEDGYLAYDAAMFQSEYFAAVGPERAAQYLARALAEGFGYQGEPRSKRHASELIDQLLKGRAA